MFGFRGEQVCMMRISALAILLLVCFQVFVVRDRALLKFVFAKPPAETHRQLAEFQRAVEKALLLPAQLNIYDTQFYAKQDGSFDFSRTR